MPLFERLRQAYFPQRKKETAPPEAYDQWSEAYDSQPDNLMLALDEQVTSALLEGISLQSKTIADVGCGTGRHWEKIRSGNPDKIIGFDVSAGMLAILKQKYPEAETYLVNDIHLPVLENESCDLVISTLTLAHIQDLEGALNEWNRILKPGASMMITDYHPAALARGAQRTFRVNEQTIAIRNYVHSIGKLKELAGQLQLRNQRFIERKIDEEVRHYYEKQHAVSIYEKFYGTLIIYGIHLMKADAVT